MSDRRQISAWLVSLVVWICLTAAPARADIVADFNHDGVLDSVAAPGASVAGIIIRVSGSAPQVFKLTSRIIKVVVSDIDHDGHLDLAALSERRGVFVWWNRAGHGRFTPARKTHVPRGFLLWRNPLARLADSDGAPPAAQSSSDGASRLCYAPRACVFTVPIVTGPTRAGIFVAASAGNQRSASPRAPPIASVV